MSLDESLNQSEHLDNPLEEIKVNSNFHFKDLTRRLNVI